MKIAIETFTNALAEEITPLGQECWDECSEIKKDTCAYHGQRGLQIDPNIQQYINLQEKNFLLAMTLRSEDGTLHGYALLILYHSLHLRKELCGNVDTFYVQPEYRQMMPRFMSHIEEEFRSRGVSIIGWPVTMTGKLFEILKKRGYIADDVIMELKLKDLPGDKSCV
jgi:GNAT superfamily N-acetyltransferase